MRMGTIKNKCEKLKEEDDLHFTATSASKPNNGLHYEAPERERPVSIVEIIERRNREMDNVSKFG